MGAEIINSLIKEWPAMTFVLGIGSLGFVWLNRELKIIKENLTNHVTGTEKKIDELNKNLNIFKTEMNKNLNFFKTEMDKNLNFFKTEMDKKLDDNFKHLNLRLDNAFSFNRPKSISKEKN